MMLKVKDQISLFEAENTTILFAKSSDTVVNAFYHEGGGFNSGVYAIYIDYQRHLF